MQISIFAVFPVGGIILPSAPFMGPFIVTVQSATVQVWSPSPKAILQGLLTGVVVEAEEFIETAEKWLKMVELHVSAKRPWEDCGAGKLIFERRARDDAMGDLRVFTKKLGGSGC